MFKSHRNTNFSLIADIRFLSRISKSRGFREVLSSTLQSILKTKYLLEKESDLERPENQIN